MFASEIRRQRAVDQEGKVLERFFAKKNDKTVALIFLEKALKRHGGAEKIVTDVLRSYARTGQS